jgi:hypothetical protein
MKTIVTHWILAISMLFTFALAATSKPAEGQVVVRVNPGHRHHYRQHPHRYYRHHRRYHR